MKQISKFIGFTATHWMTPFSILMNFVRLSFPCYMTWKTWLYEPIPFWYFNIHMSFVFVSITHTSWIYLPVQSWCSPWHIFCCLFWQKPLILSSYSCRLLLFSCRHQLSCLELFFNFSSESVTETMSSVSCLLLM